MATQVVLSKKQFVVYDVIKAYKENHGGAPPSLREVAKAATDLGVPMADTTVMAMIRQMPLLMYRDEAGRLCLQHEEWRIRPGSPEVVMEKKDE